MEPEQAVELHDWELLAAPENDIVLPTPPIYHEKLIQFDVFDGESKHGGIIRSDHFSLQRHDDNSVSVHSDDNPSWVDPTFEVSPFQRRISAESWSDSSNDDHKFSDSELQPEFETVKLGSADSEIEDVETAEPPNEGESKVRMMVWWNLPVQLIKYCVFKASPVWSFSLAAAVMGLVILVRRLYKMKLKSRNLQLKVTVDEKKVSQFMIRAECLNEAFSVARRVHVIRPSLPAAGVTPSWSMMSMR